MYAGKNHKSLAVAALHDRRSTIREFADNIAPAGKLRAILPINIQRTARWKRNLDCFLVNALELVGIKVKPDTRTQIYAVVNGIPTKETASTYSQVV
jgi:hypothetical protein